MRKTNKIVSLVLVLALLLGVFVVLPVTPVVANAAAGEKFTPNMTVSVQEQIGGTLTGTANANIKNAALAAQPGMLNGFSGAKAQPFNYAVVTAGSDTFAMFAPNLTGNYGTDSQITFTQDNTDIANTDWYVVEFDIASDSAFPTGFYLSIPLRNKSATGEYNGSYYYFAESITIDKHVAADGAWHHVAVVGDLNTQKLYFYVDGVLAKVYKSAGDGYETQNLYHTGVKFSNPGSVAAELGQTAYVDNVSNRIITGSDIAALSAAVSADNIASWSGYTAPKGGKLPAMAKVNGKDVYSASALNTALNGILSANVEFLHSTNAKITVNCDATVETHDLELNVVAGANVTVNGNTYDAPFKSSVTYTDILNRVDATNSNTNGALVKDATADATTSYVSVSGTILNNGNFVDHSFYDNGVLPYIVTDNVTGNTYFDIRPGAQLDTSRTAHSHVNWITANTTYVAGTYTVIDFDTYTEAEVMTEVYIGITSRNSGGSNKGGSASYIKNWGLPVGEWAHVTMIGDVDTNTLYVYVNGNLVHTVANGVYNGGDTFVSEGGYFQGIRVNVNTLTNVTANQNFAVDNLTYTFNHASSWLDSNAGATSLVGSDVYDAGYVLPAVPVIASVDGETYGSVAELSAKLNGNTAKEVEIFRPYKGTITVNCDAVVETNGYTAPTAGANVKVTNDGTVYTYDAPYQASKSFEATTNATALYNVLKYDVTGNTFYSLTARNYNVETAATVGVATNTITGDQYLEFYKNTGHTNDYFEILPVSGSGVSLKKGDGTRYYVLDLDIAFYDDITTLGWYAVCRDSTGGMFGTNVKNDGFVNAVNAAEKGVFHHFTTVLDFEANKAYTFMNGALVSTANYGAYGDKAEVARYEAGFKLEQFRMFSTCTDEFAVANLATRPVTDAADLATAIASGNIAAWSGYYADNAGYTTPALAPVAIVDGKNVGCVAALNDLLNGISLKKVEIVQNLAEQVVVNCDAVINTNGLSVDIVAADGINVTTNGDVKTYDAPWKESATVTPVSNGQFAVNNALPGNLIIGKGGLHITNDDNSFDLYQVTDNDTGNTYLMIGGSIDGKTTNNIYLNGEVLGTPIVGDYAASNVLKDGEGYVVYDMKLATDSETFQNMSIEPVMRNHASESSTFPFGESVYFNNYVTNADEWIHFTLVADLYSNTQYVFVNGEYVGTAGKANKQAGQYDYLNVKGFRLNLAQNVDVTTNETLLLDDISLRVYKSSDELAAAISGRTLANWSESAYDGTNAKLPSVATVDGVTYHSIKSLEAALKVGTNHRVSLDRNVVGTALAASVSTITTNGLENFIEGASGYSVIDNGDGTLSVIIETRHGNIVITLDGEEIVKISAPYGVDIAEYLNANRSYIAHESGRGAIASDSGVVYHSLTWSTAPHGILDGDVSFRIISATRFDGAFLVLENGAVRSGENDLLQFITWNPSGRNFDVILNTDQVLNHSGSVSMGPNNGSMSIYLNGHTLSFGAAGKSGHAMSSNTNSKIKIVGGNVIDNLRANTQALFYADYGFGGEFQFVNCYVYTVANIGTMRGGTLTLKDCDINVLETQGSYGISLCEYYNAGYTYNKVSVNLVDTDVRFVHASHDRSASFITIKDFSSWGKDVNSDEYKAAIAAGADKLVHEINISGGSFLNGFNAPVIASTTENVKISIDHAQFNVKNVFQSGIKGDITVGKGVVSATKLNHLADGIVEVHSGNPVAPYLYTDEYATVIWADGTTELWANGTYPTNAKYNKANVPMVEAGKTYNIGDNTDLAIAMKANLSLSANLKLNVYVPTSTDLRAISICGVIYDINAAPVVEINGGEYYYFGYEIAPHFATGDFTVVATVGDVTIAKAIDLIEYADLVSAQYAGNSDAINLAKAVLTYASAAAKHMGAYTQGYDASVAYADAAAIAVDTSSAVNTMANVNAYITSAALDLNAAPAWVFYVANGADISDLVIKVDGKTVEYTVVGNTVVVELRAYDMLDTLTVEVGGVSGQYNFAAYYTAIKALNDAFTWPGNWQAGDNNDGAIAYHSMQLLDAFYSYAVYAAAVQ